MSIRKATALLFAIATLVVSANAALASPSTEVSTVAKDIKCCAG
jgi:hypothetical protein